MTDNLMVGAYVRKDKEVQADIDRWMDVMPNAAADRLSPARCPVASSECSRRRPGDDEPAQAAPAR
ncbi:MAG: hypothetical protein R2755_02515 [Acidimicrobiales bacterium]